MDTIFLNNIRVYAHHGCLKEETIVGSEYKVDLEVAADLKKAAKTDALEDTADYVLLHKIVKEEMQIPSKLLEHLAQRIADRILKEVALVMSGSVEVAKINPPIGGDVGSVSVKVIFNR